jgi:hypothetical protein
MARLVVFYRHSVMYNLRIAVAPLLRTLSIARYFLSNHVT